MNDLPGNSPLSDFSRTFGRLLKYGTGWISLAALIAVAAFAASGFLAVEKGKAAVLIHKTGEDLPNGEIIAKPEQKGIQLDPLPEGWHWRNPYSWDWKIVDQIEIRPGQVGVKIRNFGAPLPKGQVIAEEGQKGIVREPFLPGRYILNPHAYTVKTYPVVVIEPGHVGVVTLVSGRDPANPNEFLVEEGERGVQKKTRSAGPYYVNPFIEKIVPVDLRSHLFDMASEKIIKFPSLDGFDIIMEGTIGWSIHPDRAAEVFVKFVDTRDIITCIIDEIILPNARAFSRIEGSKHLARDFIGGVTREKFQEKFLAGVKKNCASQGIIIQSALVRQITPPEAITKPIKEREMAIRLREMYLKQKERERQEKLNKMEERMNQRMTKVKETEADASVATTLAEQEKEVAIIDVKKELEVARRELKAAQDQAQAKVAKGKAEADVIQYKNAAEAQGLRNSVAAFGNGNTYVRYLMNEKLAPSILYILSNTDGPFAEIIRRALEGGAPARK